MASTTCKLCHSVTDETLTEHLAAHHLNEMLDIETDPASGVSTIKGRPMLDIETDSGLGVSTINGWPTQKLTRL